MHVTDAWADTGEDTMTRRELGTKAVMVTCAIAAGVWVVALAITAGGWASAQARPTRAPAVGQSLRYCNPLAGLAESVGYVRGVLAAQAGGAARSSGQAP